MSRKIVSFSLDSDDFRVEVKKSLFFGNLENYRKSHCFCSIELSFF